MSLSKDAILQADDLAKEVVNVPQWGGDVYVRTMTGEERDAFEASLMPAKGTGKGDYKNLRAKLCAIAICDEEGNRLFTDKEVEALGKKSAAALNKIFDTAQRLNGIGKADMEELEKNSGGEG